MKVVLIIGIISTIVYMAYVMFDGERYFSDIPTLTAAYALKPAPDKRTVVTIPCGNEQVSLKTIKSLLSQSKRVNDIGVESTAPLPTGLDNIVTLHKPDTLFLREADANTIIILAQNGKWYDYDFIETELEKLNLQST